MNRLVLLAGILALFMAVPQALARLPAVPPRWRLRLAFLALVGLAATSITLLAAVLLPEVLVASGFRELWEMCSRAFDAIVSRPVWRVPSLLAGALLLVVGARFVRALLLGARATRHSRVRGGVPRWRLETGEPVFVLPVDHPEAYSAGVLRPQVVVSRGLVEALDHEERRAVFLHEEGHVRGRHHMVLAAARAIRAALAPLPAARTALDVLEQAAEEAADEYAASALDGTTVASSLSKAALAGLRSPVGALSLTHDSDIPGRVRRLLSPVEPPWWAPHACLVALGVLVGLLAVTQALAGLAVVAAAHHLGIGAAAVCPLTR